MKISPTKYPAGARMIVTSSDGHYDTAHPYEVTVLEWSPKHRVKLQFESGSKTWLNDNDQGKMVVVEALPPLGVKP